MLTKEKTTFSSNNLSYKCNYVFHKKWILLSLQRIDGNVFLRNSARRLATCLRGTRGVPTNERENLFVNPNVSLSTIQRLFLFLSVWKVVEGSIMFLLGTSIAVIRYLSTAIKEIEKSIKRIMAVDLTANTRIHSWNWSLFAAVLSLRLGNRKI